MRKRLAAFAVYGVVTAALVAGTTAYVSLDKTVRVSVDGHVTRVHTFASSVASVLRRADIKVGPHDSLEPGTSASVHDGSLITIDRGRPLDLTVDGQSRQVWVTAGSLDDALRQAGLRATGAAISVDRDARVPLTGMSVDVELPHTITVQVDGASHVIVSTKTTVGDVLAEAGIVVNPADHVSVPLQERPTDGMSVIIVRITSGQQQVATPIPFTSVTKNDSTLLVGTKKLSQQGKNGTLVETYALTFANGKQTSKTLVSKQVTVAPVQHVTLVGTKPKPKPKPKVYPVSPDGLNWAALAQCESGGQANLVDGPFYGLYQFLPSTWRAVGGSGLPSDASPSEQTYRAQLLYKRSTWQSQWPVCGHNLFK